jgi:hypothetical protein
MKTIIKYQCEICGDIYGSAKEAIECEAKGEPDLKKYPKGMLFTWYKDITFAIVKTYKNEHFVGASFWACRDNGAGDNAGKGADTCGNSIFILNKDKGIPNPHHPTFKRMVKVLKKEGIPITCWDGEKAISLKEFLKKNKNN